jgi:hypothetical protein
MEDWLVQRARNTSSQLAALLRSGLWAVNAVPATHMARGRAPGRGYMLLRYSFGTCPVQRLKA